MPASRFGKKFETWKKTIIPKSLGQKKYFEALNDFELVFGFFVVFSNSGIPKDQFMTFAYRVFEKSFQKSG